MDVTEGKWIRFREIEKKEKTSVWLVVTKEEEVCLGEIRWYSPWRQYTFMPKPATIFETKCLQDIFGFLGMLKDQRMREIK